MKTARLAAASCVAATVVIGGLTRIGVGTAAPPSPAPDPAQFTNPQPNSYFPLVPGTVTRFRGAEDGKRFTERVIVTHRTKAIQGVAAIVLNDVLRRADGTVAEKTADWYAADNSGNVWYFGESTATYRPDGSVDSREGSWQAGVHGATAGLIMPAHPTPANAYRQELWRGHAEDQAWVVATGGVIHVPAGTYHHVVRTYEWTRLERGVVSLKLYAPGVGPVVDRDVAGGSERFVLVSRTS